MTADFSPAPADTPTEPVEAIKRRPLAVVGLGASAGGLEALETFFSNAPTDAGLAFVVVQHLSPDFKSLMDELLGRYTTMKVYRVEDGMDLEPDCVYVIPPRKEMIISNGRLLLRDKDPQSPLALPIDLFLRSLASDQRHLAIAVILSGTGSDGSRGLREVHEAGGLVLVQDPSTAKFDGMPRSAIDTGLVDLSLPAHELPKAVLRYVNHLCGDGPATGFHEPDAPAADDHTEQIIQLLRAEYGIDFRHYKATTLHRRIERRLLLNQNIDLETYTQQLAQDKSELHNLYKDLLIGVTRFFRDKEAFEHLKEHILPDLLAKRASDQEVRIWVAGCATGEEAYSLAIMVHEVLGGRSSEQVKIFATDVHRASLETAATGFYTEQGLADVSMQRRERYFKRVKDGYCVSSEIRKLVVFAPHDVVKDAPFTRLDLVTCRNLLIYFDQNAQKKVLSLFHFALKAGAILFLGPSESPGDLASEFEPVERHWKVFRKKRDIRLPHDFRLPLAGAVLQAPRVRVKAPVDLPTAELPLRRAQDILLQAFVPPSILIDANHQVVHTYCGGGRFLSQPSDGRASLHILDLLDSELKLTINGALQRLTKEKDPITYAGVRAVTTDGPRRCRVTTRPIQGEETQYLISIQAEEDIGGMPGPDVNLDEMTRERIQSLERELQYTRENLQATLEEMETANEELQATNEELVASNEELQSTNEELHSVNEELYTVNTEHQHKIRQLTEMTEDMENLFAASDVGTIFLDRDLCVRKFTPEIGKTFHLLPQDVGRHIDNFAHSLDLPELVDRLSWVLKAEKRYEAQVKDRRQRWYLMRAIPYRIGGGVQGVVLNLVDITDLKTTEKQLARMSKVFMEGADPILIENRDGLITDLNHEAEASYGWSREELVGKSIEVLIPEAERAMYRQLRDRCQKNAHVRNEETLRCDREGRAHPVLITLSSLQDDQGASLGVASIAKDITKLKMVENEARVAVRRRDEFLAMLSHELRNPLAAAQSAAVVVANPHVPPQTTAKAAGIVQRQINHVARLLDDLLDVSRVIQGKIVIQSEPTELKHATMEAVEALQGVLKKRDQKLVLEIDPTPLMVMGDRVRLRQIQENLLSNASKFSPDRAEIFMSVQKQGTDAVIRIKDQGRGIPHDLLDSIFELFTQGEGNIDRRDGGMGIGLTLVRQLSLLFNGTVHAESPGPGKGSTFTVRLPLAGASSEATSQQRELRQAHDGVVLDGVAMGKRVLIVEDNEDARVALSMLLESEGWQVESAEDGRKGLEKLLANPPALALVDIGLPGIDGFELARRATQQLAPQTVKLVALTGYGSESDHQEVMSAGFEAHLVKPVHRDDLHAIMRTPSTKQTN